MSESRSSSADAAPARWPELRAMLAWIAGSWRRPAGGSGAWEQAAGHERADSRPVTPSGPGVPKDTGDENKASGSKSSQSR